MSSTLLLPGASEESEESRPAMAIWHSCDIYAVWRSLFLIVLLYQHAHRYACQQQAKQPFLHNPGFLQESLVHTLSLA